MKVRVNDNTQIAHGDKLHKGGTTFDAPEADAREWITAGYATEVKSTSKTTASKTTAKTTTSKSSK